MSSIGSCKFIAYPLIVTPYVENQLCIDTVSCAFLGGIQDFRDCGSKTMKHCKCLAISYPPLGVTANPPFRTAISAKTEQETPSVI